jgi:hypothetical protein
MARASSISPDVRGSRGCWPDVTIDAAIIDFCLESRGVVITISYLHEILSTTGDMEASINVGRAGRQ